MVSFQSFESLAASISGYVSPILYEYYGDIASPFWVSIAVCGFSLLILLVVTLIDWYSDRVDEVIENRRRESLLIGGRLMMTTEE